MRINVSFSVFSDVSSAYASVSGELDLPCAPSIGDSISFFFPKKEMFPDTTFCGWLNVLSRRFDVGSEAGISIELEQLVVNSPIEAEAICSYLVAEFGLFPYKND